MNSHRNRALITGMIVLGTLVAAAQESGVASHPMIGDNAPAFELREVGGATVRLASFEGRYVILHFGASW